MIHAPVYLASQCCYFLVGFLCLLGLLLSGLSVNNNDDSDGHAGFSFTKLDANGNELLANATDWSCVKDNVTGLIWEVKQGGNGTVGDEGLHDADDTYT